MAKHMISLITSSTTDPNLSSFSAISGRYVKHIMTLPIKIIMQVLKVSTYIITNIAARPSGFVAILCLS